MMNSKSHNKNCCNIGPFKDGDTTVVDSVFITEETKLLSHLAHIKIGKEIVLIV
jgi:hypothetical protein